MQLKAWYGPYCTDMNRDHTVQEGEKDKIKTQLWAGLQMQAGSWRHFESLRKVSPLSGLASYCAEHCPEFAAFAFVTFFVKLYYQIICDPWI